MVESLASLLRSFTCNRFRWRRDQRQISNDAGERGGAAEEGRDGGKQGGQHAQPREGDHGPTQARMVPDNQGQGHPQEAHVRGE